MNVENFLCINSLNTSFLTLELKKSLGRFIWLIYKRRVLFLIAIFIMYFTIASIIDVQLDIDAIRMGKKDSRAESDNSLPWWRLARRHCRGISWRTCGEPKPTSRSSVGNIKLKFCCRLLEKYIQHSMLLLLLERMFWKCVFWRRILSIGNEWNNFQLLWRDLRQLWKKLWK